VDLHEIVREAAAFGTSGSRVLVEFDFPKDLWRVDGDEGQISQVIHNLVLNAVQAMPRGGTMRIRAWNIAKGVPGIGGGQTSAARVRLEMSDEGEGIPAEHLSRVFDPFFSTKPSGSGLGLATSHSIVRRHGGDITIESARGKGTTVRLELPRSTRPTADLPKVSAGTAVGSGRVLLMDDQLAVRRVAEEMLRRMGYSVVACADGREAVQIHRSAMDAGQPFDLVILDLTVPGGLGGAEALEAIRQVDPSLTAIVSSGFASDGVMAEYREHGFDAALPKPYTPDKLAEVIAKVKRAKAAAQPPRSQE
jgi:CheY-like chemotaxis protein